MKHVKSRGGGMGVGISDISNNLQTYQRWARTVHQRSQFLAKTLAMTQLEKGDNGKNSVIYNQQRYSDPKRTLNQL